jgi:uncharacterized membrane protein
MQAIQHNKKIAIISAILCTLLTATGQLLWKFGVQGIEGSGLLAYLNIYVILGFISYGIGAILLVVALKFWELSRIHPLLALGYVWVTLFAPIFLHEIISTQRIIGVGVIIIGVILIGKE